MEIKVTHEQSRVQDEVALRQGLLDGTYKSRRLKLAHLSKQVKKTLAPAGINYVY